MMNKIALLIVGYDGYIDVWNSYFELLNKYWYDRPKTYLATSELSPHYEQVNVINAGQNSEWSKKARTALECIDEKYVILLLEDFFTTREVDSNKLYELVNIMEQDNLLYCRLLDQNRMRGQKYKGQKHLKIIPRNEEYGLSLQPSVWNREYLLQLLGKGNYNPWIFEFKMIDMQLHNKNRIDSIQDNSNILEITHGIVQSKYLPKAIKVFKKQNYSFDLTKRDVLGFKENFMYRLKCFVACYSPKWAKSFLKKVGRIMKVDFVSDKIINNEVGK